MKWQDPAYSPGTLFGMPIIIDTSLKHGEVRVVQSVDPMLVKTCCLQDATESFLYNQVLSILNV